jgi:DegV family protein with EDD domain
MNRLIVTDSSSDLTGEMLQKLSVKIIPVNVRIDGNIYKDRAQIKITDFYNNFDKFKTMKTEPVTIEEYEAIYRKLTVAYDEIIFIHCSSHLSKTYDHAMIVHEKLEKEHECKVHIVDSKQCSIGLGLMVLEAGKALNLGQTSEQILHLIDSLSKKIVTYMALPTLKYLRANRKISGLKSFVANVMKIKPVLGFDDGKLVVKTKLTSKSDNLLLDLVDYIKKDIGDSRVVMAMAHGRDTRNVQDLVIVFKHRFNCDSIYTTYFGPAIGASTGPDTMGVSFFCL